MTTQMIIAQCLMVLTLVIMITGMTPIYITAITGAAISAIVAGFPLAGSAPMTIAKMINSGLNPVIADMTGILLFIGIMQATGFLDVIVRDYRPLGQQARRRPRRLHGRRYCCRRYRRTDRFHTACDYRCYYRPGCC